MVFFHSLPVPELREWVFSIPFPFPNFGNGIIHSRSRSRTPKCHSRSPLITPARPINPDIFTRPNTPTRSSKTTRPKACVWDLQLHWTRLYWRRLLAPEMTPKPSQGWSGSYLIFVRGTTSGAYLAIYCVNFGVNFILQKFCMCEKNDKYEVWSGSSL